MKKLFIFSLFFVFILLASTQGSFAQVVELQAEADAYITGYDTNGNYGFYPYGRVSSNPYYRRFLLKFNTTSIPANAVINTATLNVFGSNENSGDYFPINTHRIVAPWVEGYVTWNNFNYQWDGTVNSTTAVSNQNWYIWDVITLVRGWVAGTFLNYGVVLKEGADWHGAEFNSKDNPDPATRPKLVIDYTVPAPPAPAPKPKKKVRVSSSYHMLVCKKDKKYHNQHCKVSSKLKKNKKYKKYKKAAEKWHKKKCTKVILKSLSNVSVTNTNNRARRAK